MESFQYGACGTSDEKMLEVIQSNTPPVANAVSNNLSPNEGEPFCLDGSSSSDLYITEDGNET